MEAVTSGTLDDPNDLILQAITSNPLSLGEVGRTLSSDQKFLALQRTGHSGLQDLDDIPPDAAYMLTKIDELSVQEALAILQEAIVYHGDDVNFPHEVMEKIVDLVDQHYTPRDSDEGGNEKLKSQAQLHFDLEEKNSGNYLDDWEFESKMEAALIAFHSPYPEVRAVTDPYDDPTIPVETFRAYLLIIVWTILGSGIYEFFRHRNPPITLPTSVIQIFLYPLGKFMAAVLPDWGFTIKGQRYTINPGPYTYKEQMFATVSISVAVGGAYVSYNLYALKLDMFYGVTWAGFGYQLLLILCTQFMGFGFAGIFRKICVYPVRAMWPTLLPTLALNRALLKDEKREIINGWKISRYNFFFLVSSCSFLYFWFPNYLFEALSTFNWMNWIAPNNFNLASISGSRYGLGVNPISTFDWNVLLNLPLSVPWYSNVNQYIGSIIALFAIIGVFWSNYKWSGYLPLNSNKIFTNTGKSYVVTEVLTNGLLDTEKYQKYSPPYYGAANLVLYGAFFAIYPFSIIYTFANEWAGISSSFKQIWHAFRDFKRSNFAGFNDPHSKMMSKYPEVPDWWFYVILVFAIVMGILCVQLYPAQTPVWGIFFTIGINFVFLIPIVLIYCVTGFQFGLNVLVELIVGYAIPGNGIALMTLKALGYNIDGQAENYLSDQKLAHYAKVPPLAIFRGQMLATLIQCFVTLGVLNWSLSNIEDICTTNQPQKFSCPGDNTFFSASVFWGVIGPKRVFNGLYPILQWCFLIGALLPIPCLVFKRWGPKYLTRNFQPTLMIGGMLIYAPYNLSNYTAGMYIGFAFMYVIKRRFSSWWEKYNYVLASALNAGIAFSAIIIFFSVQYHAKNIDWWGNNVPYLGIEGKGKGTRQSLLNITDTARGFFGPEPGSYP
ncbi:hypothetical protein BABINDRAFT_31681 [Babjeviella inositovora NRRL Y-12698]|uniref:OPT family small oligopeptide transporter n=1 Tax=Babjeviella inositovora NRRL Y-12698 TaxID=984486 RepID=A0A1E3QYQ8_9ASCO|nr:uncharacterized protein BABINDRAFT_31681 [Babjeviella inositovora NRRL Y-12698]ODQ82745.1 hypothetical protein BABINDRAFT_31681 [Babjeviella inositovora NRRL Y-12698]